MDHKILLLLVIFQTADHQPGRREVGCEGNVMHVADPHESRDVGIMGMHPQRVPQEDHRMTATHRDFGGDLGIAADRAREHAADFQTGLGDVFAGGRGRDEIEFLEHIVMIFHESDELRLFPIVGDEGECGSGGRAASRPGFLCHDYFR